MALGDPLRLDPFAAVPPGSIWDLVQQLAPPAAPEPAAAVAPAPLPTPPAPTPAAPWYTQLAQGNPLKPMANPWAEALRQVGLNIPFNTKFLTGQPGVSSWGQIFQPALKQAEHQQFWQALGASGQVSPEQASTFAASGVDPHLVLPFMRQQPKRVPMKSIPGYIDSLTHLSPEQKIAMGEVMVPESSVDNLVQQMGLNAQKEATDLRNRQREEGERKRLAEQVGAQTGLPVPPELDKAAALSILQEHRQQQSQARTFEQQVRMQGLQAAQQEKLRGMTEGYILDRQRINAQETDERARIRAIEQSYQDEANRYQQQITEAERNKNISLRQLNDPLTSGMMTPGAKAAREQEIETTYRASMGPVEDSRDLARINMRRAATPVPRTGQQRLSADELNTKLTATAHDPEYQARLFRDVQKALEANQLSGVTPEEYLAIRRQWRTRR